MKLVEKALWMTGCLLMLVYAIARADSMIHSRAALATAAAMTVAMNEPAAAQSPTQSSSAQQSPASDQPEYRLWSQARIKAYQASVARDVGPLVGTLQIPALKLLVPVYGDTSELHLNRGVGLIEGMAQPGERGNLGIAGHRDGFFRVLRDIRKGERIEVRTPTGHYLYEVSDVSIVDESDATLLAPTSEPSLTLVTCYPFYFVGPAPRRFVVRGVLVTA
jgi:LPXTG-site transpeptidase (sortase) family protein